MTDVVDTTAPPAAPPPPAPPASPFAWLPGADADTVGYLQNKGWQKPEDVLSGYRNIEQVLGADRAGRTIVMPKDDTDIVTRETMLSKLGWSKDLGAYKLPVPEGADPKFAADMAGMFSKHGIPVNSAQALAADWNAYQTAQDTAAAEAKTREAEAADAQLGVDWGAERAQRTELARRAAKELGLDEAAIDAMQKGAGYVKTMKALAKVGDMLRENGADGITTPGSFTMTPEGAQSRKAQLMADREWGKRAMVKNSAEWAELTRLNTIIASTQQE